MDKMNISSADTERNKNWIIIFRTLNFRTVGAWKNLHSARARIPGRQFCRDGHRQIGGSDDYWRNTYAFSSRDVKCFRV